MSGILDRLRPRPKPDPQPPLNRMVAASVTAGAKGTLTVESTGNKYGSIASETGRLEFTIRGRETGGGRLTLTLDGYHDWSEHIALDPELWHEPITMRLTVKPLPPMLPMETLSRVRGAMWTVRWNGPMGPRPGQDTNILAMDFYEHYGPDDRKRMIDIYKNPPRNNTHAVTGPIIAGGYHGWWPESTTIDQAKWDHYLDAMQEWRDRDIIPVHFMSPDNWSLERCKAELSQYYMQPRAQALLPIKVPRGWEPGKYTASSRTWALWGDWGAEVSAPGTLIMAHTVCDVDALVGGDERYNDDGHPNGEGWQYVAPHFHGWLIQLCGFVDACMFRDPRMSPVEEAAKKAAMLAAWPGNLAAQFRDYDRRFRGGYAGWPKFSKWGPNTPMKLYLAECASYPFFHDGAITEEQVRKFGDIAMENGADGYLDSGNVEVPFK